MKRLLIETEWNVNIKRGRSGKQTGKLLIETEWNVNSDVEYLDTIEVHF